MFIEFGTQYYWDTEIKKVMDGRTGKLSIHGPSVNIDLASSELDEKRVFDTYKWAFDCYNKYVADFYVQHPNGHGPYCGSISDKTQARARALERIAKVADIAKSQNINLYIENLGYDSLDKVLFDYEGFIDIFSQIKNINCLIDVGHGYLAKWNLPALMAELGSKIKAYHIHDGWGKYDDHLHVGQGFFEWTIFFDKYKKNTPDAVLVLEYAHGTVDEIVASVNTIRTNWLRY